jgi:hypothetical protein
MPIHDWTLVDAGIFHHFHQNWVPELSRTLNDGRLPAVYYALVEQVSGGALARRADFARTAAPATELARAKRRLDARRLCASAAGTKLPIAMGSDAEPLA